MGTAKSQKDAATSAEKSSAKKSTKAVAHPLVDLIPDTEFALDSYVSRDIGGVKDLDIISTAREEMHNVLIMGPTGSAKTSLVYAAAAEANLPVVNVPCNGAADPRMLIGGWTPQPDGTYEFKVGDLVKAVQHGGIIYLDEINMMPQKIAVYLFGLMDRRRTLSLPDAAGSSVPTEIVAHEDCQIIGSMNPNYHGTRPLNQAFKNRFAIKLDFPYSEDVEDELIHSSALIAFAGNLRERQVVGDLATPISTNMLMEFEEFVGAYGFDFAITNFIAAFGEDEKQVVAEVLSLERAKIAEDLGVEGEEVLDTQDADDAEGGE
jgi:hypothetical protein